MVHGRIQGGGVGGEGSESPLKNHKKIEFLSNSGPDPLKNYEATESAFNVGPSSARQRNAILMALLAGRCWPAYSGIGSPHPSSTKKNNNKKASKYDPL